MSFHHVAYAIRDAAANHVFYETVMGFELIKVEVAPTPEGGYAKHFFYDTGGQGLVAFWEIHDETIGEDYPTALSTGMGLPTWVNHIAFDAPDLGAIETRKKRWLEHGYDVLEIDHDWCYSVYTNDPGGTMVEFCTTTRDFSEQDRREALAALMPTETPPQGDAGDRKPKVQLHRASIAPAHTRVSADPLPGS